MKPTQLSGVKETTTAPAAPVVKKDPIAHGKGNIKVDHYQTKDGATELETQMIEGRIYKPSVFYVLARSNINYAGLEIRQDFTDRIVKGALKRPF